MLLLLVYSLGQLPHWRMFQSRCLADVRGRESGEEEVSGSDAADELEQDDVEDISDDDADAEPARPPPRKRAALPVRSHPRQRD